MSNRRTGRMPPENVEQLSERSGNLCEGCSLKPATEIHHRRFLSRGGMHNLANLVALCSGMGNHNDGSCHGDAHQGDTPEGWAISRHEKRHESEIPFVDRFGRAVLFCDHGHRHKQLPDGGFEECPDMTSL